MARGERSPLKREGYERLEIWQKAKQLAVQVYALTENDRFKHDFALRDQIRRSAISVPSNIAEGDERQSDKESIRFFYIAKGSIAELRTQLCISFELEKIGEQDYRHLNQEYKTLAYQIGSIINARSKGQNA